MVIAPVAPSKYTVVVKSESAFMRFLGKIMFFNKRFMTSYVTTIGRTIYWPSEVGLDEGLLQHELQHVRDYEKYKILFSLTYLLLLPAGLTMRAFWEKRAYRISIRYWLDADPNATWIEDFIVGQFCTSYYLWMWPFEKSMRAWTKKVIAEELAARNGNTTKG